MDRNELARLAGGRPEMSAPEKEQVLAALLAAHAADPAPAQPSFWPIRWRDIFFAGRPMQLALGSCAVAALVACFFVFFFAPRYAAPEFAVRGSSAVLTASTFRISCAGSGAGRCAPGAKLLFEVSPRAEARYFASFARRQDGRILWYFPGGDSAKSLELDGRLERGVLAAGVVLGSDHPPGAYEVFGLFSAEPLTKQAIRTWFDAGQPADPRSLELVEQELEVERAL